MRAQAIARLAGFPVTNIVGKDDEVPARVQKLSWPEKKLGKYWAEKTPTAAARAVKNEYRVIDSARRIFLRLAECVVVHANLGQHLPGFEMKIVQHQVAFLQYGTGSLLCVKGDAEDCESANQKKAASHD